MRQITHMRQEKKIFVSAMLKCKWKKTRNKHAGLVPFLETDPTILSGRL